jgi:hypothetical protein
LKLYPDEIKIQTMAGYSEVVSVNSDQAEYIQAEVKNIRGMASKRPRIHFGLELLPFIVISILWYFVLFKLSPVIANSFNSIIASLIFSFIRGIIGYSWVIYALHEGAGHGLFRGTVLEKLAFNSSRILFADPTNYKKVHQTHHQYLGTENDQAFTHYVLSSRVLKSILPGAGILFPNDYKIHQGEHYTKSRFFSDLCGLSFIILEILILSNNGFGLVQSIVCLALISPWVGFGLDRIRETIEHHLMPREKHYGSRELGLNISGLIIGGGPWGQSLHFSHHLAPDLNWYQQIQLHFKLKYILSDDQKNALGFSTQNWFLFFIKIIRSNLKLERKFYEIHSR